MDLRNSEQRYLIDVLEVIEMAKTSFPGAQSVILSVCKNQSMVDAVLKTLPESRQEGLSFLRDSFASMAAGIPANSLKEIYDTYLKFKVEEDHLGRMVAERKVNISSSSSEMIQMEILDVKDDNKEIKDKEAGKKFEKACTKNKELFPKLVSKSQEDITKMYTVDEVFSWLKQFADRCDVNYKDRVGSLTSAKEVLNDMIAKSGSNPTKRIFLSALNGIVKQEIFQLQKGMEGSTARVMRAASVSVPAAPKQDSDKHPRTQSAPASLETVKPAVDMAALAKEAAEKRNKQKESQSTESTPPKRPAPDTPKMGR